MVNPLAETVLLEAEVDTLASDAPELDSTTATAPLYVPALCVAAKRTYTVVPLETETEDPYPEPKLVDT
jgi:hypothetical protein